MRVGYLAIVLLAAGASAQHTVRGKDGITLPPAPTVAKHPVTDTYQAAGSAPVSVTDNYRWLEDSKNPETRA